MHALRWLALALAPSLLLVGCEGSTGPQGAAGPQGPSGPGQISNLPWGFNSAPGFGLFTAGQCRRMDTAGVPNSTVTGDILVPGRLSASSGNSSGAAALVALPVVVPADGEIPMVVCNFTAGDLDMADTQVNLSYRVIRP